MITEFGHIFIKVFFAWNLRRFAYNKIVSSLLIKYARCNYNADMIQRSQSSKRKTMKPSIVLFSVKQHEQKCMHRLSYTARYGIVAST